MKIGIDYGHCLTGADTGAEGNGYKEQDLTRKIGKLIKQKLESLGNTVVELAVDYSNSINESLNSRINKANNNNLDWCISIHLNCGGGHGTEVFTYNAKEITEARNILNNIVALGYTNRGIKDGGNLAMIRRPQAKAMLIECCFIDSTDDMNTFNAENIANAIVKGLTGQSVKSNTQGYVVTNYLPNGYRGDNSFIGIDLEYVLSYFKDVRCYAKSDSKGIWIETQVLPMDKCLELKKSLGSWFYKIK